MSRIVADPGQYWAQGASVGLQLGEQERRGQQFQQASAAQARRDAENARQFDANQAQQSLEFDARLSQWDKSFGLAQQRFTLDQGQEARLAQEFQRQQAERMANAKVLGSITREEVGRAGGGMPPMSPFASGGAGFQEPVTGAMVGSQNPRLMRLIDEAERSGSVEALEAIYKRAQSADSLNRLDKTLAYLEEQGLSDKQVADPEYKALLQLSRRLRDPKLAIEAYTARQERAAVQATARDQQQQIQQRISAMPPGPARDQMVQFYNVYGTLPPAGAGATMMKPPGDGGPLLSPAGTLDVLRRRYEATFGKEPPTAEEREAAKADPAKAYEWKWIPGASREFVEASKAKVAAYDALAQTEDQFMRGGVAPAATAPASLANADDATLEKLDAEFVRRFGVESDPSNPDHVQKMRSLAAEMQRAPTGSTR